MVVDVEVVPAGALAASERGPVGAVVLPQLGGALIDVGTHRPGADPERQGG